MAEQKNKPVNIKATSSSVNNTEVNKGVTSSMKAGSPVSRLKPNPWAGIPIPEGYSLTSEGVFKTQGGDCISGPIWVHAILQNSQKGSYGIFLYWLDIRGHLIKKPYDVELLHEQGNSLIKNISTLGLLISPRKSRELKDYIHYSYEKCSRFIQAASQLGWFSTNKAPNQLTYILPPDIVLSRNADESIVFQPERNSPTTNTIKKSGSLDNWKKNVAMPCKGNPMLLFALCAPFVAPLLKLANMDSFGFHYYGLSSRGKTTAAQVAASVYGCGADPADSPEQAYIQRWNTTVNALEGLGASHNDGLLVMDELHTFTGKDFAPVIYNLFGGKGKVRMNKDAGLRESSTWRLILFSTGEISTKRKVEESGQESLAGQRNRLIDIPIGDDGIIVDSGSLTNANFAIRLKRSCSQDYGHAAPLFIEWLIDEYEDAPSGRQLTEFMLDEIYQKMNPDLYLPEQGRAIRRFALVQLAGYLAIKAGILPFTIEELSQAVTFVKSSWLNDDANIPEHNLGATRIQDFYMKNKARFVHRNSPESFIPHNLAGYMDNDSVIFFRDSIKEACGSLDDKATLEFMKSYGLLKHDGDRLTKKVSIDGKERPRLIVIKHDFFTMDFIGAAGAQGQLLI